MRRFIVVCCCLLAVNMVWAQSSYGPTTKADQLWQIAIAVRPNAAVTIQQTMVALFKANQNAFLHGDINNLKPGSVLNVPSLSEINKVTQQDAAILMQHQQEAVSVVKTARLTAQELGKARVAADVSSKILAVQSEQQQLVQELVTRYNNVGKSLISFDQQYQTRIADLEQRNQKLETAVAQLLQRINSKVQPQTQVTAIPVKQKNLLAGISCWFSGQYKYLQNLLGVTGANIFVGAVILLVLLFIIRVCQGNRKKVSKTVTGKYGVSYQAPGEEDDYDYMSSVESIPARLDLARAYIDMDDKVAADKVLLEIMAKGNAEQKKEAEKLLQQMGEK